MKKITQKILKRISPFQMITLSFFLVIMAGSLLLSLPAATVEEGSCRYLDALFTSGSAVCVTGLVVQNTATYWTSFGKAVILVLIQIGGLGVITVVVALSIFTGRRIGLWQRNLMQNSVNAPQLAGIIRFTKYLLIFTGLTEFLGAAALAPVFIPKYHLADGLIKSVFHSISAFCNAGFDLLGDKVSYSSLTSMRGNLLLNIVIMSLIITGGLGFLTWADLYRCRFSWSKLRMQSRIIIVTSAILIIIPFALFFFLEFGDCSAKERFLLSLFQSVTTRTAGFNTADFSSMSEGAKLVMILLMLIGGSPGSTAGGMKTTTFAVICMASAAFIRRKKDVSAFGRSLSSQVIQEAYTLLMLYVCLLLAGTYLISTLEKLPVMDCMFESASALGTVGLTTGITPSLGTASKLILILFMYFGRVGGLTLAFSASAQPKPNPGKLPEENIMVG